MFSNLTLYKNILEKHQIIDNACREYKNNFRLSVIVKYLRHYLIFINFLLYTFKVFKLFLNFSSLKKLSSLFSYNAIKDVSEILVLYYLLISFSVKLNPLVQKT